MDNKLPKSLDGLMRHLRDKKHIQINGSTQKQKLRNIGYYHGYKGYRFYSKPSGYNNFPYKDFDQLVAVVECDNRLKALFYPHVMFIETALKSYALEVVLKEAKSDKFSEIYSLILTSYKDYNRSTNSDSNYGKHMKRRLALRNKVYKILADNHDKKQIVRHFHYKDAGVPIWAIIELMTLGDFGTFIYCTKQSVKRKISDLLGINPLHDTSVNVLETIIFTIKELRNALAHNEAIYDIRFKNRHINKHLKGAVNSDTAITVSFERIFDYLVLVVYVLKKLKVPNPDIYKLINDFTSIRERLFEEVNDSRIYYKIFDTDTQKKTKSLYRYVKERSEAVPLCIK